MFTLVVQHEHSQLQAPLADKSELENLQSGLMARRHEIEVDLERPPQVAAAIASRLQGLERHGARLSAAEQEAASRLVCALAAHLLRSRPRWRASLEQARWALALRVRVSPAEHGTSAQIYCDIAVDEAVDLNADAQGQATRLFLGRRGRS